MEMLSPLSAPLCYDALLAQESDAIFVFDRAGRILRLNGAARRMWHIGDGLLPVTHVSKLLDHADLASDPLRYESLDVGGTLLTSRTARRCDGSTFPVEINTTRLEEDLFQGVVRSIEDRRTAESALRASEERFRTIQEASPDGFVLLGAVRDDAGTLVDFEFQFVNAAAGRLLHRSPATLLGRRLLVEMPGHREEGLFDAYVHVVQTGATYEREGTYVRDGIEGAFRTVAIRVGDAVAATFSDITDGVRAQEALRRSAARFRTVMERSADLVAILDATGTMLYASPSYETGLGYEPASLAGTSALALVHPEHLDRTRAALERLLGGSTVEHVEFRARHADGRWRLLEVVARNLLSDPTVAGIVVSGRDVTDHRELEAQLRQAQKMEAIGQLAGGVAHDFNNLLTVIRAHAEFLAESVPGGTEQRDDVDEIRDAASRAASLTRQFLAFSRQQLMEPRVMQPAGTIEELQKMLRRLIGEDIALRLDLADREASILADPGQLEQVILNLVVNARDAMPRGGTIELSTHARSLDAAEAASLDVQAGPFLVIAVRDSGVGIPPEIRQRIFEPFFTTKPLGKGTGLGLSTVYGIVRQSDGAIRVDSEPARGSTFTIFFPIASAAWAPGAASAPAASATRGNERILLVEDDEAVRSVSRRILQRAGYVVLEAADGHEALRLLGDRSGEGIQLIVTDAVMPRLSGLDMIGEIGQRWPEIRIVLVSGYTDDDLARRGALPVGARFLHKPFSSDDLRSAVRAALDAAR